MSHVSNRVIFTDHEVDPMKISNFFEIFFSSKMVKNDVLGLESILGFNRYIIWGQSRTAQGYKLALKEKLTKWRGHLIANRR